MKQRIIGIDVARAFAVIGMIIVNFKVVLGENGSSWIRSVAGFIDGKAAATFVVLAGLGLALMTNSALREKDNIRLKKIRISIRKKALFLFVVGVSYLVLWPADILHFYGVYMLITLLFLRSSSKTILIAAVSLIAIFPFLMALINYGFGWDFETLAYQDFWTFNGFIRNLFFNGFHPVIPWTAFMLFGFWFGKQDLNNDTFLRKAFWLGSMVVICLQILSPVIISILSAQNKITAEELSEILGTNPMPPLPIYMINGLAFAVTIISASVLLAKRFCQNIIVDALAKTGQLALTFYVAHVIIGMGIIELISPYKTGEYPISFSVIYALSFSLCCVIFAVVWRKYKKLGPIEWLMRKCTE